MSEEIKKIKKCLIAGYDIDIINQEEMDYLWNYITNLQQDLEKANDIIEKDRQFYKCRIEENIKYKQRIDKAINYYVKELSKRGSIDDVAVEMYNLVEGNK